MTTPEGRLADHLGRLNAFARGLGVDEQTVRRIAVEVEAEADQAGRPISIVDRLAEARNRLMKEAEAR